MSCCLNVQRFSSPCGCGVTDQGGVSTPENLEERARFQVVILLRSLGLGTCGRASQTVAQYVVGKPMQTAGMGQHHTMYRTIYLSIRCYQICICGDFLELSGDLYFSTKWRF